MLLKHEQIQNCVIYHAYMIFDVNVTMTMSTEGKFHWALKVVRKTTKSVLLNRFGRNKILISSSNTQSIA